MEQEAHADTDTVPDGMIPTKEQKELEQTHMGSLKSGSVQVHHKDDCLQPCDLIVSLQNPIVCLRCVNCVQDRLSLCLPAFFLCL